MAREQFGQDPTYKIVRIGLNENSYFPLMKNVSGLKMFIVRCNNLDKGIGSAKANETGFSKLGKLLYSFVVT